MTRSVVQTDPRQGEMTIERTRNGGSYVPRFDIFETDTEMIMLGDLPGVSPDDLDIRYENQELTVHGKVAPRHEGVEFLYGEYGIGDFYRSFTIGEAIDGSKISAELKNGVLVLRLPKVKEAQPRKIEVKAG